MYLTIFRIKGVPLKLDPSPERNILESKDLTSEMLNLTTVVAPLILDMNTLTQ